MATSRSPDVLYIAYWGAAEPLGQSLVLPALEEMSERGVTFTLISYEKATDLTQSAKTEAIQSRLRRRGVRWCRLRYHKRPRVPATLFDLVQGWSSGVALGRKAGVTVIHGRTFIGGLVGRAVASTLRVPFVYHNEGFYPDEMADGGFWRAGSAQHRLAKRLEAMMYDSADGLVVLSHRAADAVSSRVGVRRRGTPIVVVPSCVDLARFRLTSAPRPDPEPLRLVYSGAAGGRYELDRVGRFVARIAGSRPTRLQVLSREPRPAIAAMLGAGGLDPSLWSLRYVDHSEMPGVLCGNHAGLFFLARGKSEHGCSPTKIGEYWACGLPVVTSAHVSDIDDLVRHFRSGVIIEEHTDEAYAKAGADLIELLRDPELSIRCRAAAEQHYALGPACERQMALYHKLITPAT